MHHLRPIFAPSLAGLLGGVLLLAGASAHAADRSAPSPQIRQNSAAAPASPMSARQALEDPRFKSLNSRDPTKEPRLATLLANGFEPRFLYADTEVGMDVWFYQQASKLPKVVYTYPNGCCVMEANIYSVRDGKMYFPGGQHFTDAITVLIAEGKLSQAAVEQAQAMPQQPAQAPSLTGRDLRNGFEKASWIEAGKTSAPLLYAVVDPECPWCHKFWQAIRPFVENGDVRVRLIVAAALDGPPERDASGAIVLKTSGASTKAAIEILSADDAIAAWDAHVNGRPVSGGFKRDTGIKALTVNEKMRAALLVPSNLTAVPMILSRSETGKLGYHRGIDPNDVPALVSKIRSIDQTQD